MTDEQFFKKIGGNISQLRKSKGFTQLEFAKMVGIHRTALTRIELGNTNCTIIMLRKIAASLDVKLEDLIKEE